MKNKRFFMVAVVLSLIFYNFYFASAEQKSITLPKGTKVEKLGPGYFKFKLPNRQIVEVKGFNPKTGALDYVGIINPDPPGKPVTLGKQGRLQGQAKSKAVKLPPGTEYVMIDDEVGWTKSSTKVPGLDYVMIDDEVVWLPITIQFQPEVMEKTGLSPQPDPPVSPGSQLRK